METYAQILLIAMPVFFALVLGEQAYGYFAKKHPFKNMDTISSLSSGFTNSLKDVLGLSVAIITYAWFVDKVAIFEVKSTIAIGIIAFIALDFAGYWVHRMSHQINFFWNKHAIHHSSEEFNLACALRQSISTFINLFTVFLLPAALLGVPATIIAIIAPIHLFAQFWYHTIYIKKMGFLEKFLVTPSHHRVHHAINPEYLDRNHGQIFIIWDKLFGTYQEELEDVPPVYGITRPVRTWNPFKINFQHLWLLTQDAWRAESWKDKFSIWFMPTGWRPEGFEKKYPVEKITDPYNFQKYAPEATKATIVWSWIQFMFTFFLLCLLYANVALLSLPQLIGLGAFIFLSIYAYTEFMDRNKYSIGWEIARNLIGMIVLFQTDWFGLVDTMPWLFGVLAAYFVIASLVTFVFVRAFAKSSDKSPMAFG
jgi:sterol desaturase/sphingolipid hydroxylase (fatty acid hydroxylase superfamily)